MHKFIFKFDTSIFKKIGIILGLIFYISSLQAQQTQSLNHNQRSSVATDHQKQAEVEQQRRQIQEEAQRKIIPEAIAVIGATRKALSFANKGQSKQALAAIEQAMGKIDLLLARHPQDALLPVDFSVTVVDTAPLNNNVIKQIGKSAKTAVADMNYPLGRLLLDSLRSEINLSFYCLPLAIYPGALREAGRLLDQQKTQEAALALKTALTTLLVIDQVIPIPVIHTAILLRAAEKKLNQDQDQDQDKDKNKNTVIALLDIAKYELERAKELGYSSQDKEYTSLDDEIKALQENIKKDENSGSKFESLREKVKAFLHHLSRKRHKSQESTGNTQQQQQPQPQQQQQTS